MPIFTTIKGDVIELSVSVPLKGGTIDEHDLIEAAKARLAHMDVLIGSGEVAQPEGGEVDGADQPADDH